MANNTTSIYGEPKVAQRNERRRSMRKVTSNGTIAAAVMVFAAILAVIVANSPAYEFFHEVFEAPLTFGIGGFMVSITFEAFVNDFLMAIFFLLVGIELKYEVTVGQLRKPRQAALPMLAAVGGVAMPAIIYAIFNAGGALHGWAIPIATDIAFALGVMSLLGDHISPETKVFFQTLAIADDILAIVVIALFYGGTLDVAWIAASLGAILVLWWLNRMRVYSLKPYTIVGFVLWVCMFNSGIHATLAGVILAFFLPAKSDVRLDSLHEWLDKRAEKLENTYDAEQHVLGQHDFTHTAKSIENVIHHVTPPLERMERYISVPVNFFILPLFAFVNAQLRIVGADLGAIVADPVAQGVFFGAVLGKPIGIIGVTWLLVKIGFAKLPKHVDWLQIIAVGLFGGLGFTMSILISGLAFSDPNEVMAGKCAIMLGSVTAAVLGLVYVRVAMAIRNRGQESDEDGDDEPQGRAFEEADATDVRELLGDDEDDEESGAAEPAGQ